MEAHPGCVTIDRVNCPACQHEARPGAAFCEKCGTQLPVACAACSAALSPGANFCAACGAPVAGGAPTPQSAEPAGARKTLSILFADLVGSTGIQERLDPESTRRFMERYYAVATAAVERHGGKVTQFLGDGVLAMFGLPRVAEDDAMRAVRAGVAMQEGFAELAEAQRELVGNTGLRVAINTGELVVKQGSDAIGDPVNVAFRLQDQAQTGDVVISGETRRYVADQVTLELLGSIGLRGRSKEVKAYRVAALEPPGRENLTTFVGREAELARIEAVYQLAVATPSTRLAVLLGSPGLGKSRLIAEFARRHGEQAQLVSAHCDAAGGATFAPIAEAIRRRLEIDTETSAEELQARVAAVLDEGEDDHARITKGIADILDGRPGVPEESFYFIRRFLAGLSRQRPVVLIIDDLQWAGPVLLDLVEHLVQWGRDLPLLLLVGARPELREQRQSLTRPGGLATELLQLGGLGTAEATQLAAGAIGAEDLPAAVAARVLATSEGNPLFIRELVRLLVEEGALLRGEDGQWQASDKLAAVRMPPTVQVLLTARIERLEALDSAIIERAAVIGRQFSRGAIAALLPEAGERLDARLEALQGAELIERGTGWLLGEPVLRFHHVLIRDAAYRRVLKGTRAELHEQFANWVESRVGDAREHDETIGRHFEDAHRLLGELGPLDEHGQQLGERAATRLAAAGRRALAADDLPLAANLLGRALQRLAEDDPARAPLAIDWAEALLSAGDVGVAEDALAELARWMEGDERLAAWHACLLGQHTVLTAPRELSATVAAVSAAAQTLAALEDTTGEAKAHFVQALALSRQGQVGDCEAALDRALAAARQAGDRRQANTVLAIAPVAALWGPGPVTRASGRCLDVVRVLRITQGAPAVEAVALMCQGVLEALRGRAEAAQRMIAAGREMVEELGISQRLCEADVYAGFVALVEGELPAAEEKLRRAYEGLKELGLRIDAARAAALLARSLLAQERIEEAIAASEDSEALAGDDLKAAIAWRAVRAQALARQGEHTPAIALARAAVEIAAATDALLDHADARHALEVALHAAGQQAEAAAEGQQTRQLWQRKGAALLTGAEDNAAAGSGNAQQAAAPTASAHSVAAQSDQPDPPTPASEAYRPNAASRMMERYCEAFNAGDIAAARAAFAEDFQEIHHPARTQYGLDGHIQSLEKFLRNEGAYFRRWGIQTLGEHLSLERCQWGASGNNTERFDVGPYQNDFIHLTQTDRQGLGCHSELFAGDKMGEAVVRLFELYAQSLPAGPERDAMEKIRAAYQLADSEVESETLTALFAPNIVGVDHRTAGFGELEGAEKMSQAISVMLSELSDGCDSRILDLHRLSARGVLILQFTGGTAQATGGRWEREILEIYIYDEAGQVSRWERFEPEQLEQALARYDELTDGGAAARPTAATPPIPAFQPNASSQMMERFAAAMNAQDFAAARALLAEGFDEIHHPTQSRYGADGNIGSLEAALGNAGGYFRETGIATLGDSLFLARCEVGANGNSSERFDVGPYRNDFIHVVQTDAQSLACHSELFAGDKIGAAVVRLFELYAQSLPPGPKREAAERLHTIWVLADGPLKPAEKLTRFFTPNMVLIDHRTPGVGRLDGAGKIAESVRVFVDELTEGYVSRVLEVHRLSLRGTLELQRSNGIDRNSGGPWEREILDIYLFDAEGFITHHERFEPHHLEQALSRYDELTGAAPPVERFADPAPRQKSPANVHFEALAAGSVGDESHTSPFRQSWPTGQPPPPGAALVDRLLQATATQDEAGIAAFFHPDYHELDHENGSTFDRAGVVSSLMRLLKAQSPSLHFETLASLGPGLSLCKRHTGAAGTQDRHIDAGPFEFTKLQINAFDEQHCLNVETFAETRLGLAIARLYERYYEGLAQAGTPVAAQGIVTWVRVVASGEPVIDSDLQTMFSGCRRDIVAIDHRHVGFGTLHGIEAVQAAVSTLICELSEGYTGRAGEIAGLSPRACLVLHQTTGRDRASGGDWEREICELLSIDTDGRLERWERFEPEQQFEQALARYRELTGQDESEAGANNAAVATGLEVGRNAAVAAATRVEACWAAGDWPALRALFHDDCLMLEHPTGSAVGPDEVVQTMELLSRSEEPYWRNEALAVLGSSLFLSRRRTGARRTASKRYDFGDHELVGLQIFQTDEQGLLIYSELFAEDKLGLAVARLYELYYDELAQNGQATQARAPVAWLRPLSRGTALTREEFEQCFADGSPDLCAIDHRHVGFGRLSAAEAKKSASTLVWELTDDYRGTVPRIGGVSPRAVLLLHETTGRDRASGGQWERSVWELFEIDAQGWMVRWERFGPERQFAQALARFRELSGEVDSATEVATASPLSADAEAPASSASIEPGLILPPACFTTPVIELAQEVRAAWNASDWKRFGDCVTEDFRCLDRRRLAHLELSRDEWLTMAREFGDMPSSRLDVEVLASRGQHLVLWRHVMHLADGDVGPSVIEQLNVLELDPASGRVRIQVRFDPEDSDKAYAELDARYAAEDATPTRAWAWFRRSLAAFRERDWAGLAALYADEFVSYDRRSLSVLGTVRGPQGLVDAQKALIEMAPDTGFRLDYFVSGRRGGYWQGVRHGTREGGSFEIPTNIIFELNDEGLGVQHDVYDDDSAIDSPRWKELGIGEAEAGSA